jgi:hypothetical protein
MVLISYSCTSDAGCFGNVSNNEKQAMVFNTEEHVRAVIADLDGGVDYWGTRPTRPHK